MDRQIENAEYVIVDTETTGLLNTDRIVEIAIIRQDGSGKVLEELSTLINPQREVSGTEIHGITASDVKYAPLFQQVAGDVLAMFQSAVFVAHNAVFDIRMVANEFKRIGIELPDMPVICTMAMAKQAFGPFPSRRLDSICNFLDIELENAHSAYADAKATAQILKENIKQLKANRLRDVVWRGSFAKTWPKIEPSHLRVSRDEARSRSKEARGYLSQLLKRLPVVGKEPPELDQYYLALDRVLEDRKIETGEADMLFDLATNLGVSKAQIQLAHENYMERLVETALADGILSDAEQNDLSSVAELIGFCKEDLEQIIELAQRHTVTKSSTPTSQVNNLRGKTVCFTGECQCRFAGEPITRDRAQQLATQHGLIVKSGVSKKLDILVVADPDSLSSKAQKAREYGTHIIAEPVFWGMIGVGVE